jgi:NhaA family Na+:H+ antiporter
MNANQITIIRPIQEFFKKESTAGIVLLINAVLAMILANSPWAHHYFAVLDHHIEITLGERVFSLDKSVESWINDFLMAGFFFLIGLEIKREILAGELSNMRAASLPIIAAIGGMVVPALIYLSLNSSGHGSLDGWGVPMATDIAFSIGVLTLLGTRIPLSLKIFLTALAIVDDIGAMLVIALFYTEGINTLSLVGAGGFFAILVVMNLFKVRELSVYVVFGTALWLFVYESGVHPTIAGFLVAMTIPARRKVTKYEDFEAQLREEVKTLRNHPFREHQYFLTSDQAAGVFHIFSSSKHAMSMVQRMEHAMHPFVAFFILPLFALANAGIPVKGEVLGSISGNISLGIIFGLIFGKQIGIMLFTWLAVRLGLGRLPGDLNWKLIFGASCLAGIGFTMSIFIANLAFDDDDLLLQAKIGIMAASLLAFIMGYTVLRLATSDRRQKRTPLERSINPEDG